jgi:excisionase family DNA binding protein
MAKKTGERELITTQKASEILKVSQRQVVKLINKGKLPFVMRVGTAYLIDKADLALVKDRKRGRPRKEEGSEK